MLKSIHYNQLMFLQQVRVLIYKFQLLLTLETAGTDLKALQQNPTKYKRKQFCSVHCRVIFCNLSRRSNRFTGLLLTEYGAHKAYAKSLVIELLKVEAVMSSHAQTKAGQAAKCLKSWCLPPSLYM